VFESQRGQAGMRAIAWDLTLGQWYAIWLVSGKLELRGRGKGRYCMSRIKGAGGYVLGNVHIQLCTDNSREAVEKWRGQAAKEVRGVYHRYPGTARPFVARHGRKEIGRFSTLEQACSARAAYIEDVGLTVDACGRAIPGKQEAAHA
jgi:hypothetical protein